ncbi:hypothetical protein BN940_00181 [Castellaniella defragrans 65Phen]|uniref:Uncharacterized protein n=1 Tax=Castellaniella defragrans (strain DSM 12143 / CCUG 39792 / 65Phen) TaxID=1437824 RepID=W8WZR9_CASD6|nr:hypothetical protein BN940_00181 [Castellaniella defragrans 65Phen]
MRQDTGQSLRTVLCLPNPSRVQAARWRAAPAEDCPVPAESDRPAGREVESCPG